MEQQEYSIQLKMYRKLGTTLLEQGIKMLRNAFKIVEKEVGYDDFLITLKVKCPNKTYSLLDGKYYLIPLEQWIDILNLELLDYKTWVLDHFDCDDFSRSFASYIYQIFEINSIGTAYGRVYNKDTNKLIAYHYWNVFLTKEADNEIKLYFFEPGSKTTTTQTRYIEYNGTGDIIMGNWKYEPISLVF